MSTIGAACQVSAVVTAYNRVDRTLATLKALTACEPPPAEILVHVDANQVDCASAVREAFPNLMVILSENRVGPGGGRNRLIRAAQNEFVASFDDDSFPVDRDYFARVELLVRLFPAASIVCGSIYHRGEDVQPDSLTAVWVSDFAGGACVYRKSSFMSTDGYVPLAVAYGMEEVDLAIQLHNLGCQILQSPFLRVRHDTTREHHAQPSITAGSIANIMLLTYLRYPISCWWIGFAQLSNRILFLIRAKRFRGIFAGLCQTPTLIRLCAHHRKLVSKRTLDSYFHLRRHPVVASETNH